MTVTKSRAAAPARPARKSPLRAATLGGMAPAGTGLTTAEILTAGTGLRREAVPAPDLRRMEISEFTAWLRSRTNKHHRPFQADTIAAYADAARALHEWMTGQDIDGDFTACDTAVLNRFFADYLASHGQGGTNTRQRNLRHLFTWLEETYGHPHPWTTALHRYAPAKKRPSTLAQEFIARPARGHRRRPGAAFRGRAGSRDDPGAHRRRAPDRADPAADHGPVDRPDRPAVRPGGAAEGRPGVHRGPDRAADRPRPRGPSWRICGRGARTGWRASRRCGWGPATGGR